MSHPLTENSSHSRVHALRAALAAWLCRPRHTLSYGRDELARLANDLNLSTDDVYGLARSRPDAADEVTRLLHALRIDSDELHAHDPASMRDMQRVCIMCSHKARCRRDLATGAATERYRDYCPNVFTLDLLQQELPARN